MSPRDHDAAVSTPRETVCAVIVTHNRRELLAESVGAVLAQSRPVDAVLVIDNASDDGTPELLADRFPGVEVHGLAHNEGGAGGFHEGIKRAHARGYTHAWLMDDDTIPEPQTLSTLLEARRNGGEDAAFVASKVVWTDGRVHPMNRPLLSWKDTDRLIETVASDSGLLPIRATTFVSLLLNRNAVDQHGLPDKRYFMWSDDIEYTARITNHSPGYIATRSVVVHKTPEPHTALTSGGQRYYFHARNTIYMVRSQSWSRLEKVSLALNYMRSVRAFLRREGFSRQALAIVARGIRDGLVPPADPSGPYLRRS